MIPSILSGHPTIALSTTIAVLMAAEVPLPVEMTALVMVGLVLRWALYRDNKAHEERDKRIERLEEQILNSANETNLQRHLKHALNNQITAIKATLTMMLPLAKLCTCGTMAPLIPILERLAMEADLERLEELILREIEDDRETSTHIKDDIHE